MLRSATLEQTWKRFAPRGKRAGITRIAELTGLDTLGIPVCAAIRPMGLSLSTQQGKGVTPDAARISALMESLETWSAEHVSLPIVRGSYRALAKKRRVVDVRKLPRTRSRLSLDERWSWIEGRDMISGDHILVPLQAVSLDTTFDKPPIFDVSSNGLGAGNNIGEAILQGVCEVLERDAEAAWRRSGGDRRLVLDTITDPTCLDLIGRITRTGARIFIWDLEPRANICAIGCGIMEDPREPAWRALGMYQGFGAHWQPEVAITRAIVEAAQTRLTYIAGGRDDFFPFDYERATDPELMADIWSRLAAPCDSPAIFDDLPRGNPQSIFDGLPEVIVVDLTHPELRVPCVKILMPGFATDVEALG
ncbi:MAG TPA: YcaO-like family protein [Kofleriaceae bacterium]|jgi:YcaO-like protein with predicted kinase domain|nr:YcaO-like family protein [Kofleriaceae bacterium]